MSTDQSHYKTPDKLNARKAFYDHVLGGNRWREIVKESVHGFDGMSILDAGCGSGEMLLLVIEGLKDVHAVGFDLSEGMVEEAKRRAADAGRTDVTFTSGDVSAVKTNEMFDRLMILHVLHLVENPGEVLEQLLGRVKAGGRAVITLHSSTDMPKLKSWNRWLESETGSTYTAGRERFTLENPGSAFTNVRSTLHSDFIDHTIRLTDPQPFIDYINTTRDRWEPAVTDEQWLAFLEHVRSEIQRDIDTDGHFDEHSVTGLVTIDV